MKKLYLFGIVMIGWSVVSWAMDEKTDFDALRDISDKKSYGAIDVWRQRTDRLAAIRAAGVVDGLIYKKDDEVITSLAHHPTGSRYTEGTTASDGSMYFRQRGINQQDGMIAKKNPPSPVLVKYSPNGRSIAASAGHDLVLYKDNVEHRISIYQNISSIEFSSSSDWLILSTSSENNFGHKLSFFDIYSNSPLSNESYLCELEKPISLLTTPLVDSNRVSSSADFEKLACGGSDKIFYYTFDNGRVATTLKQENSIPFKGTLHALKFTQDGRHLLLLRDNVVEQVDPLTSHKFKEVAITTDAPRCLVPLYTDDSWLVGTQEGSLVNIDPDRGQVSGYPTGLSTVALISASPAGAIVVSDGKHVKSFCLDDQHKENQKKDYTIENGILALHSVQQEKALQRRKRVRQCFYCCVGTLAVAALTVVTYIIRGQRAAS